MIPSSSNSKILLTVVAIIMAVFVVAWFVARPLVKKTVAVRQEIAKNKAEMLSLSSQSTALQNMLAELNRTTAEREKIASLFPSREEMEYVVIGLEDSAEASGLSMNLSITDRQELPVGADKSKIVVAGLTGLEEVPFVLNFSGSYRQILDFFLRFDNSPYMTKVTSLSVVAQTQPGPDKDTVINSGSAVVRGSGVFFMRTNP